MRLNWFSPKDPPPSDRGEIEEVKNRLTTVEKRIKVLTLQAKLLQREP